MIRRVTKIWRNTTPRSLIQDESHTRQVHGVATRFPPPRCPYKESLDSGGCCPILKSGVNIEETSTELSLNMLSTSAGDDMYTLGSISIAADVSKNDGSGSDERRLALRYCPADPPVAEVGGNDWPG